MSLLKLTSHLYNVSRHRLHRLQIRNFQQTPHLCKQLEFKHDSQLPEIEDEEYGKLKTIYKFPYMTQAQFVYNSKYYLPIVYVPLWLTESVAFYMGDLSTDDLILMNVLKMLFLAKCLLFNKWFTHLIGFMYVTEDEHLVIAHATFSGRRINEKFAKGELILETNKKKILDKFYVILRCKATGRRFKLNLKIAEMNELIMIDYFGTLPSSAF